MKSTMEQKDELITMLEQELDDYDRELLWYQAVISSRSFVQSSI